MDTNKHESGVLEPELVYQIMGAAIEVMNAVGHGLHEKAYEKALAIEFGLRGLSYTQQEKFPVTYKGRIIAEYIPDLLVDGRVIVDTKTIDGITDQERGQMLNYLRICGLRVGLLINFKRSKLEWQRVVL